MYGFVHQTWQAQYILINSLDDIQVCVKNARENALILDIK